MNNSNSNNSQAEKTKNNPNNNPKRIPRNNSENNTKETSKTVQKSQNKTMSRIAVNKDIINESKKTGQRYLDKKEGSLVTEVEKKSISNEKSVITNKKEIKKETAASFKKGDAKPADASGVEQKKPVPFTTTNKDVIGESGKTVQEYLEKKEDALVTEVEKKNAPNEKSVITDKKEIKKETALSFKKEEAKPADAPGVEQKKTAPLMAANKDIIGESPKTVQECLEKKENTVVTEVEKKGVPDEKIVITDTKEIEKETAASLEKRGAEPAVVSEMSNATYPKMEQDSAVEPKEKKEKLPSSIDLRDKSDVFKKIIDIALVYEKLEDEQKRLKNRIKAQNDEIAGLKEERDILKRNLEAAELLCQKKQSNIDNLKADIEHRNEVISIVKADKVESSQEFKNALAASLRMSMKDFKELKELDMNDDVGYAVIDILESVFKILDKNGISI